MKPYVKPDIMFEDFRLTQNVAACAWDMNNQDVRNCEAYDDTMDSEGVETGGIILFTEEGRCHLVDEGVLEGYCYTVLNDGWTTFSS